MGTRVYLWGEYIKYWITVLGGTYKCLKTEYNKHHKVLQLKKKSFGI